MRLMLIINPVAGKGQYRVKIAEILETLIGGGYIVTVYMTQSQGDATNLVKTYAADYDVLACCGGDGTLSETIAGLMALSDKPPIGYIPLGTSNDVAATLRLPKNAADAAKILLEGTPIPFDVGCLSGDEPGGDYFTYIAAFGAFTQVSYQTPQETKQTLGHFAYMLEGMGHLGKITPHFLTLDHDGGRIEGTFIFGGVTNTTSIAGLIRLKPELVELGDGLFEVLLVKNPEKFGDMNQILRSIFSQDYDPAHVTILQTRQAVFTFDEPVRWTRDGEDGGVHRRVTLENRPQSIRFIVPGESI